MWSSLAASASLLSPPRSSSPAASASAPRETDPVGGVAAAPGARRWSSGFDPPDTPWGAGSPRGRPGSAARAGRPDRACPGGCASRGAGRPRRRRRRPRRHAHDVRAGRPARVAVGDQVAAGDVIGRLAVAGLPLPPPRLPALGLDRGRDLPRPAAARRRRSACVCCRWGATTAGHVARPTRPVDSRLPAGPGARRSPVRRRRSGAGVGLLVGAGAAGRW